MKRMLDVLYFKNTGHVLTAATRPGEAPGPDATVLGGEGLFYPIVASSGTSIIRAVIDPASPVELAVLSAPFADGDAGVLFQRAQHAVVDGALATGLATLTNVTRSLDQVTVTLPAAAAEKLPYVIIGVPTLSGAPVIYDGEVPASQASYVLPHSMPPSEIAQLVMFVKGFVPTMR
jgi:hypothetical protein